jgi:hypothetical protein
MTIAIRLLPRKRATSLAGKSCMLRALGGVRRFQRTASPPGFIRANLLQELKRAYTGKKKRSVGARALRLLSKPGGAGPDFLPNTQTTVEALRALSSNRLREF